MSSRPRIMTVPFLFAIGLLALNTSLQAQPSRCSNAMAQGTYAFSCSGHLPVGEGDETTLVPTAGLDTAIFDGAGNVLGGEFSFSAGGVLSEQSITGGSGVVNPNCTASAELFFASDDQMLPTTAVTGVVLSDGDRILLHSPLPGSVGLCQLDRVSLD